MFLKGSCAVLLVLSVKQGGVQGGSFGKWAYTNDIRSAVLRDHNVSPVGFLSSYESVVIRASQSSKSLFRFLISRCIASIEYMASEEQSAVQVLSTGKLLMGHSLKIMYINDTSSLHKASLIQIVLH